MNFQISNFPYRVNKFQIRRGFTIIELSIYMGLMAIFIVTLTEVFLSVLEVQTESQQNSSVESDGRYILNRLNYDISRASSITVPATLGATASAAIIVVSGANYTFDGTTSNFILTDNIGSNQLNSDGSTASDVSFMRLGNVGGKNNLQIKFKLTSSSKRQTGVKVKDFQTTIGLR